MASRNAMLCTLLAMALVGGCSQGPQYESVRPGLDAFEPFELPLAVNEQGVAVVEVESSSGTLKLILDTGADQAILLRDDSPVTTKLERVDGVWKSNARGEIARSPVYRIEHVTLGPLNFTGVRAVGESSSFPEFMPGDGMLGRGLLEGLTLDIDLPGRRLGILPAGKKPADFDASEWLAVPLLAMDNGPMVPMRIDDSGRTLTVVLDTGAIAIGPDGAYGLVELPGDLRATDEVVEGLPVYQAQDVRLGEASIGPLRFFVMDHVEPPGSDGFLGNALYGARRVLLVPSEETVFLRR